MKKRSRCCFLMTCDADVTYQRRCHHTRARPGRSLPKSSSWSTHAPGARIRALDARATSNPTLTAAALQRPVPHVQSVLRHGAGTSSIGADRSAGASTASGDTERRLSCSSNGSCASPASWSSAGRRSLSRCGATCRRPPSDPDWPGDWFHRRLLLRQIDPVCQLAYSRIGTIRADAGRSGPA